MSGIVLPKGKVKASRVSPRKLVIYSKPKVGKTSAVAALENTLILDFEKGSDYVDAVKVSIDNLEHLRQVGDQILAEGRPYKRIVVDTITKVEDMALTLAKQLYMDTPMGKNFKGDNVLNLPNGAGYQFHRQAMEKINKYLESLADEIIYLGHMKLKYMEKNGKEVTAAELDLIGKVKSMICADVDAIGLLYRDGDKCILSFKTTDDVICGARPNHLKNKDIILSEINDKGEFITHWNEVYID
jgi:hypothetical protein